MQDSTGILDQLEVIREGAHLLSDRYAMIADVLKPAVRVFDTVIQDRQTTEFPDSLRNELQGFAAELTSQGSPEAFVDELGSFEAVTLFDRFVDLQNDIEACRTDG